MLIGTATGIIIIFIILYFELSHFQSNDISSPTGTALLINSLDSNELRTNLVEGSKQPNYFSLFPMNADRIQNIMVNGNETIMAYEYANDSIKQTESVLIMPDGKGYINYSQVILVNDTAPIHFFLGSHIIVKYIGNSTDTIRVLESLYGGQFAGA